MKLGLLFDLDGTIVDSEPFHLAAFRALFLELGHRIGQADFDRLVGTTSMEAMRTLLPELDGAEHRRLVERKEELFRTSVDALTAISGLPSLLARASASGIRLGIVTNAPRSNAEFVLRHLGVDRLIETIVSGCELTAAKPDPLPYLVGLDRLGLAPYDAIAFEDSVVGVRSATAAGIWTVGVRTVLSDGQLRAAGASLTIDAFDDPPLARLLDQRFASERP